MSNRTLMRVFLVACVVLLTPLAWAANDSPTAPVEKKTRNGSREKPRPQSTQTSVAASASSANWEVYQNIAISSGGFVYIDSNIDFSSHDTVAVAARCASATSAATSMDSVDFQAMWGVSGANLFAIVEHLQGSKFAWWDAGGGTFQVYGPQFRLVIFNNGSSSITLDQVTLFTSAPQASAAAATTATGNSN
jgi:hypothetical protein